MDMATELNKLQNEFTQRLEGLQQTFDTKIKEVREDALRKSVDEMATGIHNRLTAIESRLSAIEDAE